MLHFSGKVCKPPVKNFSDKVCKPPVKNLNHWLKGEPSWTGLDVSFEIYHLLITYHTLQHSTDMCVFHGLTHLLTEMGKLENPGCPFSWKWTFRDTSYNFFQCMQSQWKIQAQNFWLWEPLTHISDCQTKLFLAVLNLDFQQHHHKNSGKLQPSKEIPCGILHYTDYKQKLSEIN